MKKAIKCGKLFDSRKGEVQKDRVIFLEGNRITAVEPAQRAQNLENYEIIDHSDKFVMPGLIDAHIHLHGNGEPGNLIPRAYQTLGETALAAIAHVQDDLMAGITACRCCGDYGYTDIAVRDSINKGESAGPRLMVSCVAGLTTEHLNPYLIETTYALPRANGIAELRRAVRYNLMKIGADFVKYSSTGSVLGLGSVVEARHRTYNECCAIVEAAEDLGKTTACHAHATQGIKDAILAGTTSIEHGTLMDDECVALMKERGTFLVPTLSACTKVARYGRKLGTPEWGVQKAESVMKQHYIAVKKCFDAGVKIAFGTDCMTPGNYHGTQTDEYEMMVEAGMTPAAALRSGTILAAELMRMDDIGVLEAGKLADIVAFQNDPTEDITEMTRCCFVMKDGVVYKDGDWRRSDI